MDSISPDKIKITNGILEFSVLHDTGLGTWISFISYALENFKEIRITETLNMPLKNLKIIVDTFVLDDKIKIITTHKKLKYPIHIHDQVKFCSGYIEFNKMQIHGQTIPIWFPSTHHRKPSIGVAMIGKKDHIFDNSEIDKIQTGFPWNRYYSFEEWAQIFKKIKMDYEYDIITLDNIEEFPLKVLTMFNMCDAIICYEGGIAHLAHALGKPVFMLPWRKSSDDKGDKHDIFPYLLHLDKKTYFLKSINELLEWDWLIFGTKIEELKNYGGNHPLLFGNKYECTLDLKNKVLDIVSKKTSRKFYLDDVMIEFLKSIQTLKLGGMIPIRVINH